MSEIYIDAGPPASGQKVCLATTAYANLDPGYVFSIQRSRLALADAGIQSAYLLVSGNCHVDDARNAAVAEFLGTDCTDLVFLDADVSWDEDQIIRLCQYPCDVVGGVYPYRREGMREAMPVRPLLGDTPSPASGLVEVEGLPTGFLRLSRKVLETLAKTVPHFESRSREGLTPLLFERVFEDGIRWGGDLNFCRKWRALGGHVYAASEMRLGHAGRHMVTDSLTAMMRRMNRLTLRHVTEAIREGRETENDYYEVFEYANNAWGAPPAELAAIVALAREADGPIIESGSGLTTILMAAATTQTVFCLEHDPVYAAKISQMAAEAGVGSIGLCFCPIKDGWYDLADYPDLPDRFALGFNDGPPRNYGDRMPFFEHFGARSGIIVCDDADEDGYRDKIEQWAAANGRRVDIIENRTALIRADDATQEKVHAAS